MSNRLEKIEHLPEFIALAQARKKIAKPLALLSIGAYALLICLAAFFPNILAMSFLGGATSWGIALGLAVIILCFIVTGIYASYANRVIEPLVEAAKKKIGEMK